MSEIKRRPPMIVFLHSLLAFAFQDASAAPSCRSLPSENHTFLFQYCEPNCIGTITDSKPIHLSASHEVVNAECENIQWTRNRINNTICSLVKFRCPEKVKALSLVLKCEGHDECRIDNVKEPKLGTRIEYHLKDNSLTVLVAVEVEEEKSWDNIVIRCAGYLTEENCTEEIEACSAEALNEEEKNEYNLTETLGFDFYVCNTSLKFGQSYQFSGGLKASGVQISSFDSLTEKMKHPLKPEVVTITGQTTEKYPTKDTFRISTTFSAYSTQSFVRIRCISTHHPSCQHANATQIYPINYINGKVKDFEYSLSIFPGASYNIFVKSISSIGGRLTVSKDVWKSNSFIYAPKPPTQVHYIFNGFDSTNSTIKMEVNIYPNAKSLQTIALVWIFSPSHRGTEKIYQLLNKTEAQKKFSVQYYTNVNKNLSYQFKVKLGACPENCQLSLMMFSTTFTNTTPFRLSALLSEINLTSSFTTNTRSTGSTSKYSNNLILLTALFSTIGVVAVCLLAMLVGGMLVHLEMKKHMAETNPTSSKRRRRKTTGEIGESKTFLSTKSRRIKRKKSRKIRPFLSDTSEELPKRTKISSRESTKTQKRRRRSISIAKEVYRAIEMEDEGPKYYSTQLRTEGRRRSNSLEIMKKLSIANQKRRSALTQSTLKASFRAKSLALLMYSEEQKNLRKSVQPAMLPSQQQQQHTYSMTMSNPSSARNSLQVKPKLTNIEDDYENIIC